MIDDAGREVAIVSLPQRIVSLVPSATSILVALGAADQLVARTDFDHDPELAGLAVFSETLTPSVERIVDLDPDLVVAWPHASTRGTMERLAAAGMPLYQVDARSIADIMATIERLGALVGRPQRADSLIDVIRRRIRDERRRVLARPRPSVLFLLWHDPPYTAGPGSYVHEIVEAAGGRNAFADLGRDWGQASAEMIVLRDPDWIVVPQGDGHDVPLAVLRASPWAGLSAVREGRVLTVDGDRFSRPGPDVADAVEELARALHPEVLP